MAGTTRAKTATTTSRKKAENSKTITAPEKALKTRSASSRRDPDPPVITYMGRARTYSENDLAGGKPTGRADSRRPPLRSTSRLGNKTDLTSSSCDISPISKFSSVWDSCLDATNGIGSVAKNESKYIRRMKLMRKGNGFESQVASDENLVLIAIRINTEAECWSLDSCSAYLPIIMDNIESGDEKMRKTVLNGLESIVDTWLERIVQFSEAVPNRIGVDVAAEDRYRKSNACIKVFHSIVENRDQYYKQLDEESIYKLDLILEKLKIF